MKMKMKEDRIDTTKINLVLDIDINLVNIKSLSMMILICIKEHLSNIWSSIHEKVSNAEAELKKSVADKKGI